MAQEMMGMVSVTVLVTDPEIGDKLRNRRSKERMNKMKKVLAILMVILIFGTTVSFAGGDKNTHRHDGSKGKGTVKQVRVNK